MAWIQGAGGPLELAGFAACALDGKVYVTGGQSGGVGSNALQIYDTQTGRWSQGAGLPVGVYSHSALGVDGAVYVFGGLVSGRLVATVYRYDVGAGSWSQFATMPRFGRRSAGMAAVGGRIYIFGGISDSGGEGDYPERHVLALDLSTGSGQFVGSILPTGRYGAGCVALGSKIYLVGGYVMEDGLSYPSGRCEVYDPAGNTFQTLASMPVSSSAHAAAYGDEIYAAAGGSLLIYSPEENGWRYGESIPSGGGAAGSLDVVGNRLFVVPSQTGSPILSLDLRTAEIVGVQPAAGFVDEGADNQFSWQIAGNAATGQARAVFQWREGSGGSVREIPVSGSATRVIIPAGTFPNAEIAWRVRAVTTEGVETPWSAWFALTCMDQPHDPPGNLYPSGGRRDASGDIQFSWVVNSPLGSAQTAFIVQVSYNDGESWENLSGIVHSAVPGYIVQGGRLIPGESGRVSWRVCSYNTDGRESDWSEAAGFLALVAPPAPSWVGVESGQARPLARWLAVGQAGYQLQVLRGEELVQDSGWLAGTQGEHRVGDYLHNGGYVFRVRVRNALGLESPWSETAVQVATQTWYEIGLEGEAAGDGVRLQFTVKAR